MTGGDVESLVYPPAKAFEILDSNSPEVRNAFGLWTYHFQFPATIAHSVLKMGIYKT